MNGSCNNKLSNNKLSNNKSTYGYVQVVKRTQKIVNI